MFASTITLSATDYDLVLQRAQSSDRTVAARPLGSPAKLTISHEENSKSKIVSTAVILSDKVTLPAVAGVPTTIDDVKVLVKLQYNPYSGRTTTEADVQAMVEKLIAFLTPANVDKLLNLES